jgi:hypothetical protein
LFRRKLAQNFWNRVRFAQNLCPRHDAKSWGFKQQANLIGQDAAQLEHINAAGMRVVQSDEKVKEYGQ